MYTRAGYKVYIRVYGGLVAGGRIDGVAYSLFMLYTPHHTLPDTLHYASHTALQYTSYSHTGLHYILDHKHCKVQATSRFNITHKVG